MATPEQRTPRNGGGGNTPRRPISPLVAAFCGIDTAASDGPAPPNNSFALPATQVSNQYSYSGQSALPVPLSQQQQQQQHQQQHYGSGTAAAPPPPQYERQQRDPYGDALNSGSYPNDAYYPPPQQQQQQYQQQQQHHHHHQHQQAGSPHGQPPQQQQQQQGYYPPPNSAHYYPPQAPPGGGGGGGHSPLASSGHLGSAVSAAHHHHHQQQHQNPYNVPGAGPGYNAYPPGPGSSHSHHSHHSNHSGMGGGGGAPNFYNPVVAHHQQHHPQHYSPHGAAPPPPVSHVPPVQQQQQQQHHAQLPLCPADKDCAHVNDKSHQSEFSHTCRLFPCFHAHIPFHTYHFRHVPGQAATPSEAASSEHGGSNVSFNRGGGGSQNGRDGSSSGSQSKSSSKRRGRHARKLVTKASQSSTSFAMLSPDAPNATKITVIQGGTAYEVHGDWSKVRVHTFKRYLHQVCGIRPVDQQLLRDSAHELKDDLKYMSDENVREGTQIVVRSTATEPLENSTGIPTAVGAASSGAGAAATASSPTGGGDQVSKAQQQQAATKKPRVPLDWL